MKFFIIALCALGCAYAAVEDSQAQVLRSEYEQTPDGGYHYVAEISNGISLEQQGKVKQSATGEAELEVSGSNTFQAPDGQTFSLTYTADENGYNPQGSHLPTPPPTEPIPDYIVRSIEYIAAHPYQEKKP